MKRIINYFKNCPEEYKDIISSLFFLGYFLFCAILGITLVVTYIEYFM